MPPVPEPRGTQMPQSSQPSSSQVQIPESEHVNQGTPYNDPASLLKVIPLSNYAPTARVAQHIASHTVTYPPPSSSAQIYHQHQQVFQAMDRPQNPQDWAVRQDAERRLAGMMRGAEPGYGSFDNFPLTGPPSQLFPLPSSSTPSSSTFPTPGQYQPFSGAHTPLPYSFLPSFPSSSALPPTPTSLPPSTPPPSGGYFEDLVDRALARTPAQTPRKERSTASATPTISRAVSRLDLDSRPSESPDPLGMMGPSPTKRRKSGYNTNSATLPAHVHKQTRMPFSSSTESSSSSFLKPSASSRPAIPAQWQSPGKASPNFVVEIPTHRRSSVSSKASQQEEDDEESDELDWGARDDQDADGDWRMGNGRESPSPGRNAQMMGSRTVRTGDRDMRSTQQKFQTLLEDLFEAADSLPADPDPGYLSQNAFFDRLSADGRTPLLSSALVDKITRYVARLNSSRRAQSTDKAFKWDEEGLKRVFHFLERTIRDAEGVEPFPSDRKGAEGKKKAVKKGKKVKGETAEGDAPGESLGSADTATALGETELEQAEAKLNVLMDGIRAVECCLTILDCEGLSKPMYSEDLLTLCVGVMRHSMSSVVFPVVEGIAGEKTTSQYLSHLVEIEQSARKSKSLKLSPYFINASLSAIAQSTAGAFPHLSALISRPDLSFSDSLIIQTVYLATAPLFVTEGVPKRTTAKDKGMVKGERGVMKTLRMEALSCLRGAFAKYSDQRQWIIEEILSSLIKLPDQKAQAKFQFGDGSSMNTITALLLQLIQASSHGISSRIIKIRANAGELEMSGKEGAKEEARQEEIKLCQEAVEAAYRTARVVAGYLIQKSSSNKASKTTTDTDYKAILDKFVEDMLAALYRPQWPAASLFLSVFSKLMIAAVEDSANGAEATATRNMALDHLGAIAARLKAFQLEDRMAVASLDQVISSAGAAALLSLQQAHGAVHAFLSASKREDGMFASADDLSTILWTQELHAGIDRSQSVLTKLAAERDEEAEATRTKLLEVHQALYAISDKLWASDEDVFGSGDSKPTDSALSASIAIARHRPLQSAFDPILQALLQSMDFQAVALRSKALRGLSAIVQVDPEVLGESNVRQAFEARLSDSSPAVRDSAVDLIGKYMVQKSDLAAEYYPHIALRVNDTGLAVRKKVIKLLRDIFSKTSARIMRKDICCKMVEMIGDDDDNVKEMAIKALAEMLHTGPDGVSRQAAAALLVDVIGHYRGPQQLLEDALQNVAQTEEAAGKAQRSEEIVEALIQRLIDATEEADFDSVSHIRAISLLCASKSDTINPQKAAVLLNYLQPPANSDDQASNDLLLRIFRLSIPSMPRTASTFANELAAKLLPMISKPSGGFSSLNEVIGCFCAVVTYLTKDYGRLIQILRACEARLQSMEAQHRANGKISQAPQAITMTLYLVALLAEHCNLDQVAVEDHIVQTEIRKISERPLFEHLFDLFLDFTQINISQVAPTTSLGCLLRAYPSLVLREETHAWIDRTFATNDFEIHARLFGVIHEFLTSEAKRKASGAAASKDMDALIGSASDLTESGVSTAIVQTNIQHILNGAKSHHVPTQNAALDVLAFTVNQGLYHPIQCMPILISLETHEDQLVSTRALDLHATLHRKHSGLVNVRYLDFARASFEYQRSITSEVSGHRDGVALLAGWFSLVGEKRVWKLDFLRALCRAFEYDSARTSALDVGLALFLAENLATFEYKQQEEVMVIIQQLSGVVSTCTPLVSTVEQATVKGQPRDNLEGRQASIGSADNDADTVKADCLINATLIVSLALLTKKHLLDLYTLTEDKCLKQATVKKSALGERPATRKGPAVLQMGRIPLVRGVETVQAFQEQQATFLQLIQEDGTIEA